MSPSQETEFRSKAVRVQSVLYNMPKQHVERSIACLARALAVAKDRGVLEDAEIALGDCSPSPTFDASEIAELEHRHCNGILRAITYQFFDKNLGSARGHNTLLEKLDSEWVLILNPDTIVAPNVFVELTQPLLDDETVGLVEARQVPIEHPKHYDSVTKETSWAATACALVRSNVVKEINGFDADTFFLYCDDVDFSWRIRLAGYKVLHQPSAMIFHDKRLSRQGEWIAGPAEEFYSAEAALLLAHKWSRPGLVRMIEAYFTAGGTELQRKALASFRDRRAKGTLPTPIDGDQKIGQFIDGNYAVHRF